MVKPPPKEKKRMISWSTVDLKCDAGSMSDLGRTDWTNPTYAWDGNDSNFATASLPASPSQSEDLYLTSTESVAAYSSYTIARVWFGCKWKASVADASVKLLLYVADQLSGANRTIFFNETFPCLVANTEQTDWLEVTGLRTAWTWAEIENMLSALSTYNYAHGINNYAGIVNYSINQFYVRVEYTTENVDRNILTCKYTSGASFSYGSYNDVDWTDPSYAWDKNDSNRASCDVDSSRSYSYLLQGQGHDNVISSGEIKCVNLGLTGYKNEETARGIYFGISETGVLVSEILGTDLGSDAPSEDTFTLGTTEVYDSDNWTWADVDGVYLGYGFRGVCITYINQLSLVVVYYTPGGETPGPYELKYRKGGATVVITTYVTAGAGWNEALAIQVNATTYYAQCDSNLSHANASDLRVRIGGVTYAVLTEEGTPT